MKVQWDENKCRHAGLCVKSLPSVFKIKRADLSLSRKTQVQKKSTK